MASDYRSLTSERKSLLKPQHELKELIGMMNRVLGLSLPDAPQFEDLKTFKKFCSDLLEGHNHWFDGALSHCGKVVRSTVASSLFLFRKRLPSAENISLKRDFCLRMGSASGEVDQGFLEFVKTQIPKLFRPGWDRLYDRKVASSTLSTSSCLESSRLKGGCRGSALTRDQFIDYAAGKVDIPFNPRVKVSVVRQDGKDRLVTIGDSVRGVLGPLHTTIYDHLSRKPWLLRGDAKTDSFREFTTLSGEVFVSGDYESATDNIPLELYQFVLRQVLSTCQAVPERVRYYAEQSSQSILVDGKTETLQVRGQLMGNLLSFPFLCLINFLAFKYVIRRRVPLKINGDDIVFRATRDEARRWMAMVGKLGLTLSLGKTLVDNRLFSLNSTFFRAWSSKVRMVPFIRSKSYFGTCDSIDSFRGQYESFCPGFGGAQRSALRSAFLLKHRTMVWKSRRSLTKGLEMRASKYCLQKAGLWAREVFYLRLPTEPSLPSPPSEIRWETVPKGWRRLNVTHYGGSHLRRLREAESEFFDLQYQIAWSGSFTTCDLSAAWRSYWDSVRRDTFKYVHVDVHKLARLLKLTVSGYRKYLARSEPILRMYKKRKYIWVFDEKVNEETTVPPIAGVENERGYWDVAVMGTARQPFFIKTRVAATQQQWAKPVSFEGQIVYGGILLRMSNGPSPFRSMWRGE